MTGQRQHSEAISSPVGHTMTTPARDTAHAPRHGELLRRAVRKAPRQRGRRSNGTAEAQA